MDALEPIDPHSPARIKTCWSQVGTWGKRDCPELSKHVHCRNCPTYAQAAALMLEGPMPSDYVETWTRHFARAKAELPRDSRSLVTFRIEREWFGLPVPVLVEVVERRPIHSLPQSRFPSLLGLVNIRGQLLICVSLARLLRVEEEARLTGSGCPSAVRADRTNPERLLVVRTESGPMVFPVNEVFGLWRYRAEDLRPVPASVARGVSRFTQAVLPCFGQPGSRSQRLPAAELVGLLDEQRLFRAINEGLT